MLRLVLRRALRFVVAGLIIPLAGAAGLTRVLQTFLFGVSPTDPIGFTIVTLLLMALGLMRLTARAARHGSTRGSAARGIAVNGTFGNEASNGARLVTTCFERRHRQLRYRRSSRNSQARARRHSRLMVRGERLTT